MMNGKIVILGVAMSLMVSTYAYATSCHGSQEQKGAMMAQAQKGTMMEHMDEKASTAVEVGNKICPVTGEKVGMMGPVVQYEYQGKVYNFCCSMCIDSFKKDPEKYIKKVEEELAAAAKEEKGPVQDSDSHKHMHEGGHH